MHSFEDLEEPAPYMAVNDQMFGMKRPIDTMVDQLPNKRLRYDNATWTPQDVQFNQVPLMQMNSMATNMPLQQPPQPILQVMQPDVENNQNQPPKNEVAGKLQKPRKGRSKKDGATDSPMDRSPNTPQTAGPLGDESSRKKHFLSQESVAILKAWFYENLDHPYPTADQKEQLSKQTGLTYLQVSNWFTNSRKRVWAPGIRSQLVQNGESKPEEPATKPKKKKERSNEGNGTQMSTTPITPVMGNNLIPDYGAFDSFLQQNSFNNGSNNSYQL